MLLLVFLSLLMLLLLLVLMMLLSSMLMSGILFLLLLLMFCCYRSRYYWRSCYSWSSCCSSCWSRLWCFRSRFCCWFCWSGRCSWCFYINDVARVRAVVDAVDVDAVVVVAALVIDIVFVLDFLFNHTRLWAEGGRDPCILLISPKAPSGFSTIKLLFLPHLRPRK